MPSCPRASEAMGGKEWVLGNPWTLRPTYPAYGRVGAQGLEWVATAPELASV